MMMMTTGAAVWILVGVLSSVNSYPRGAPPGICSLDPVKPNHGGLKEKPLDTLPFEIFMSKDKVTSLQDNIIVTIKKKSPSGPQFKGFLVVARDSETGTPIGTWKDDDYSHSLSCGATTHDKNTLKDQVDLEWKPVVAVPKGRVVMKAVIVEKFDTFWIDIPVSVKGVANPSSLLTPTKAPVIPATNAPPTPAPTSKAPTIPKGGVPLPGLATPGGGGAATTTSKPGVATTGVATTTTAIPTTTKKRSLINRFFGGGSGSTTKKTTTTPKPTTTKPTTTTRPPTTPALTTTTKKKSIINRLFGGGDKTTKLAATTTTTKATTTTTTTTTPPPTTTTTTTLTPTTKKGSVISRIFG